MRIRVESIPEEGRQIEETVDPSALQLDMPDYRLTKAIFFSGRAARSGENVTLKGTLTGSVDAQCGRCLNDFKLSIDLKVDTVFIPRIALEDGETEVVDVDASFSYYDGDCIDLPRELRELIIVSLPIRPVCREDCRGLCSRCGVDLNQESCQCGDETELSPFSKLKELKARLEK
jgi:uncharacterized protein